MAIAEGVIKYRADFLEVPIGPGVISELGQLDAWRQMLFAAGLIGQDPNRYGGQGYGNLSQRLRPDLGAFVITATQTSGIPILDPKRHYTVVTEADIESDEVSAFGALPPSSEALTHAAIYQADRSVGAVFHAHSPDIWQASASLGIPATTAETTYGTPEMAREIAVLVGQPVVRAGGIVSMLGHEDGIITFGTTAMQAGKAMLNYLKLVKI